MEELEKHQDPLMGFYFSCPHCQQNYVSAECVQEHLTNCQMESSSSFMIPKITSYSSLNPQALDLNVNAEGFPIRHEIIKREPQDYVEDDYTDWQDENNDSTLSHPDDIHQAQYDPPSLHKLQPGRARQTARILFDSDQTEDSNSPLYARPNQQQAQPFSKILRASVKNPNSTCREDRYMCRYCPRIFPFPSTTYVHEASHTREPKFKYQYPCPTCGQCFRWPQSLDRHMKSHEPNTGFYCCFPGCPQTFKCKSSRWIHHKTHPVGRWNAFGKSIGYKNSNPIAIKSARQLLTPYKSITNKSMVGSIDKSPSDPNDKSSKNAPSTNNWKQSMKSQPPAQIILCSYPDCSMVFKSESSRWIHHKTHADPNDKSSKNSRSTNYWKKSMKSQPPAKVILCCYPGCSMVFKSTFKRWIHHKSHPKGRWNASGRRPGWNLRQNKTISPPKLKPENVNITDNESIDNVSMPDLSPMAHSEIKPHSNLQLDNVQQSAAVSTNESKDLNIPAPTRRKGRRAKPGHAIEVMTPWGTKFKCDKCDKTFNTRYEVKDHRLLKHFDKPQISCYITGCSQMFFSRVERVIHLKSVHHVRFQNGKPFIGKRLVAPNMTGARKVIAKGIISNASTARKTSQSPQKIQLNKSPNPDHNIPQGSETRGLSPANNISFTCGICGDSYADVSALKCHMMMSHVGPEESLAQELKVIGTPAKNETTENSSVPAQQLAAMNGATILDPSNSNSLGKPRRRGRPARPGDEIEIMTAWGTRFKCDKCDKTFLTRVIARDHRLGHFDEPQLPCYVTGCSQMFFSRIQRVNHLKSVHHVKFRKGKPFIGFKPLQLNTTGARKVIAKEISPNVNTARQPSQSPKKIQLNKSPKSDQNATGAGGSQTEGLGPGQALLHTCGVCDESFGNFDVLECHMLTTHAHLDDSQAQEIDTPVDDSIGSDQYTCEEDPLSEQVTENQDTSNLSGNLNAKATYKGSVPRYPIVMKGGKKYFYCGFPDCTDVFTNRTARYLHHRKYHQDAYRSMLTNLAGRQLSEKTVNETLSTQPKENNSDDEKKTTRDMESPPDFPFVQVNGKKYFWCDVPDCGVVLTNLEARYLHYKKHQIKLEQVTSAQDSQGTDPMKRKLSQEGPRQYYNKRRQSIETNVDDNLGETLPPNQPEIAPVRKPNYKEVSAQSAVQNDQGMPAQLPLQTLAVALDEDFEGDEEEEMLNWQNQSMDPLQLVDTDNAYSPMESISQFNRDFNTESNEQTDSGHGSELSTEASSFTSNPALQCNISNPTSSQYNVVQRPSVAKERKSKGRPPLYASIEIGTRKLFCCDFPGCGGVFNSRRTMYGHAKRHRMGKRVNSKLKLTEDGTLILDSAEGCYVVD